MLSPKLKRHLNEKNALSDRGSIHGHRNLNKTERFVGSCNLAMSSSCLDWATITWRWFTKAAASPCSPWRNRSDRPHGPSREAVPRFAWDLLSACEGHHRPRRRCARCSEWTGGNQAKTGEEKSRISSSGGTAHNINSPAFSSTLCNSCAGKGHISVANSSSTWEDYILLKTQMGNENRWQIEFLRRFGVYTFFREWEDPSWP